MKKVVNLVTNYMSALCETVIFMTFEEAKQQAIERLEWVLCHGAHFKLSKQCTLKR